MGVAKYIKTEKDAIEEVILQSGIKVKTEYGPGDLEQVGFDYAKDLADAGHYPFTRGIHPQGYRSRAWTTRQYSGFGTPQETNERFKLLISHGQTGLNVAFDLPTQMGYDSDDPIVEGEVGRVGMAVDTLRDFEVAFADIQLDRIGSGLTINAVASIILAMYQAMAEKRGFDRTRISATPQNDILKEMIGRGAWIYPVHDAVRLIGDTIEYSITTLPRCNPVSVCGYHIRESGANPAQEIGFALEIAAEYINEARSRGLSVDDIARRITFNFNIFGNLWEQVAKFRAARKLWARMLKEEFGAENPKSMHLRGLFGGGGFGLTKAQPENNIIRSSYYALAAALAGAQTTALCSFDEAFTIPTPRAALLSLRTCELLMDEIGLRDTVDPLAGSYFIETLTKQMEDKIQESRRKIQDVGGMIEAVSTGFVQKLTARQAYEWERGLKKGEYIKIGVNKYVDEDEPEVELHEYDPQTQERQVEALRRVKAERSDAEVSRLLKRLEKDAREKKNVMPALVECCKAYATVGEMAGVFREVFGEFREPGIF
ncbi:MAG: methylmalonyl-CoA mutase family protein [Desulfomonilaceae bacterium]|nr:methylmalonyl-CoA mutase family protein [Desulfomonilaceae bacterium]